MQTLFKLMLCTMLVFLVACHSEKPDTSCPVDIEQAARKAGITLTNTPAASVTPEDLKNGERMTIIGMLREVGTARFSRLVITPLANYDIHLSIKKNQMEDYPRLQHTFIEVTGVVTVQKVQFGTNERNWYSMTVESARRVGK
ncbi:MAG TPA: hypothetical protein PK297_14790 [Spirochaetota bacterium]|nr:hypothetical protein [Spirochaetota bacterium]